MGRLRREFFGEPRGRWRDWSVLFGGCVMLFGSAAPALLMGSGLLIDRRAVLRRL
jgi:hypothetical protein